MTSWYVRAINISLLLFLLVVLSVTALFNFVVWTNSVNYGMDMPYWVTCFSYIAGAGIAFLLVTVIFNLRGVRKSLAAFIVTASVFAAFSAYLYGTNNVMMDYETWLSRGQPDRPLPWQRTFWVPVMPWVSVPAAEAAAPPE